MEKSKAKIDVDEAKILVASLKDSTEKDALQSRTGAIVKGTQISQETRRGSKVTKEKLIEKATRANNSSYRRH